jgi:hypothetical protein
MPYRASNSSARANPLLAGNESLIDGIFLNPNVSRKHLSDEEACRSSPVCRQ